MARHKDKNWNLSGTEEGGQSKGVDRDHLPVAVLMDIRDELQELNALLACPNFTAIPDLLRRIRLNTAGMRGKPSKKNSGAKTRGKAT